MEYQHQIIQFLLELGIFRKRYEAQSLAEIASEFGNIIVSQEPYYRELEKDFIDGKENATDPRYFKLKRYLESLYDSYEFYLQQFNNITESEAKTFENNKQTINVLISEVIILERLEQIERQYYEAL